MSVDLSVHGFRPPDERWDQMKAIYDSCKAAGVSPPGEVEEFFDYTRPDDAGAEVEIPIKAWNSEYASGYEINIKDLPKDVYIIRAYLS